MRFFGLRTIFKRNFASFTKNDFYGVLGLRRDAAESEIKKAYFDLAKLYHPDVNKDPEASEKFAKVNEAYEVLGDLNKRKAYDSVEFGGTKERFEGDFQENWTQDRSSMMKGDDANISMEVSFLEAAKGVEKIIEYEKKSVCKACKGSKNSQKVCVKCKGSGYSSTLGLSIMCSACQGHGKTSNHHCYTCQDLGYSAFTASESVHIPAGINTGQVLRLSNKGHQGEQSSGDLLITVLIKPHEFFKREGQNIHSTVRISLTQAVLGDEILSETIHGKVKVKIQPGTSSGDSFKIPNHGIQFLPPDSSKRGDHVVAFKVKLPKSIGFKEKGLFLELAKDEGEFTADEPPMRFKANIK